MWCGPFCRRHRSSAPACNRNTCIGRGRKINAITIPSNDYNRDIYGFAIIRYVDLAHAGGFALAFNSGVKFTKSNLYKLVVGEWTLTWGP